MIAGVPMSERSTKSCPGQCNLKIMFLFQNVQSEVHEKTLECLPATFKLRNEGFRHEAD